MYYKIGTTDRIPFLHYKLPTEPSIVHKRFHHSLVKVDSFILVGNFLTVNPLVTYIKWHRSHTPLLHTLLLQQLNHLVVVLYLNISIQPRCNTSWFIRDNFLHLKNTFDTSRCRPFLNTKSFFTTFYLTFSLFNQVSKLLVNNSWMTHFCWIQDPWTLCLSFFFRLYRRDYLEWRTLHYSIYYMVICIIYLISISYYLPLFTIHSSFLSHSLKTLTVHLHQC